MLLSYSLRSNAAQKAADNNQLSIDTAKRMCERDLAGKARLNMIREEVHSVCDYDPAILNELDTLSTGNKAETEQLKKDIRKERLRARKQMLSRSKLSTFSY